MRYLTFLLSLGFALVLSACLSSDDKKATSDAIAQFHSQLDNSQFEQIYDASGDEMKRSVSRDDFVKFLSAVHRKLGNVKSSTYVNYRKNMGTGGTFITINNQSTFPNGEGSEQFVFKMTDGAPILAGYHINSMALVTG